MLPPAPQRSPRAFGGGPLNGDRLVRFVYLDEAGTSVQEPVTIVAGIIIHADSQWKPAAQYLEDLRTRYVPPDQRDGFIFHAKELFSGGKQMDRAGWPAATRWEILEQLLRAPRLLNVSVALSYCKKDPRADAENWDLKNELVLRHLIAFLECIKGANSVIKNQFPGEIAALVAEDNTAMRQKLRALPRLLKATNTPAYIIGSTPFDAVVDTVHFAAKSEAPLLQIADACAFVVRRYLAGQSHGLHYLQVLTNFSDPTPLFKEAADPESGNGCKIIGRWDRIRSAHSLTGTT
jgi:hypothetical protein